MQPCDDCGVNQANVHVTQIMNDQTTVFHLCETCAKKRGITISIEGAAMAPQEGTSVPQKAYRDLACGNCHLQFSEFHEKGRLGCAECYSAFDQEIDDLLTQVHGASSHKGKQYRKRTVVPPKVNAQQLRAELESAVRNEEFELAAELRDALNDLLSRQGS